MATKKTADTESTAAAAPAATAEQVTAIAAALLTSPRYASAVKDPAEQDRLISISITIAAKINAATAR